MTKRLKCFIYTRVSTELQLDGYSLEAQRERVKKEATHRGMKVIGEYSDEGKSGKNVSGRPEFQQMLNDISRMNADSRPDYVLVFKLSRFGRNAADTLSSLQFMEDYGVHLLCVEDGIDSAGAAGKLMISVLAAVAEIERENIKEQTMAGREQKARNGEWNGGFAPFGYKLVYNDRNRGELQIDEIEAELVRIMFDKFVNTDMGLAGVAKYMNESGYRKPLRNNSSVERFSSHFVKEVIDNPIHIGKIAYGRRRTEKIDGTRNEYHVVKQAKDSYELYEGNHEAIISEDMWYKAQAKREVNGYKREKVHSLDHEHVLSALLKCPVCGANMYGAVNRKKKKDGSGEYYTDMFYYVCKNRKLVSGHLCDYKKHVRQDLIDDEVEALIIKAVNDIDFSDDVARELNMNTDVDELYNEIERLEQAKKKEELKKKKLLNQIVSLDPEDDLYDTLYEDLSNCLQEFTRNIAEIDASITRTKISIEGVRSKQLSFMTIDELKAFTKKVFTEMPDAAKKEFMNYIIESIEIFPERQKNGRQVKSIKFRIPAFMNELEGEGVVPKRDEIEEIELGGNSLANESHDETVVLLSQQKPDDVIEVEIELDELDLTTAESKATYKEIQEYVLKVHGLKVSNLYISQVKRKCGIEVGENYNLPKSEDSRQPQCPVEKEKAIKDALEHFGMI